MAQSEMVYALRQGASQHVIMPSAVPNLKQLVVRPRNSGLACTDILLFANMKIHLTGTFGLPRSQILIASDVEITKRDVRMWI
jgi:hypothetical protein